MLNTGYIHLGNKVPGSVQAAAGPDHKILPFPDSFSKPASGSNQVGESRGWLRFFSVTRFSPFFDVDTSDVLWRICYSLLPYKGDFVEKIGHKPDIYGPFWICTTLVFVAAALGNFASYLTHNLKEQPWEYDIDKVTWSAGMFYGYSFVVPLVFYYVLNHFGVTSHVVQLWCLYGYSLFIFIPASFLSAVPVDIFRWVIAGITGVVSATFLALNMRSHIRSHSNKWLLYVAIVFLMQLGMALVLKL
ncbi:hypothetical protein KP509_17G069200 [Ceratopteris richardii]|uniref:Protein YIP n=1 Tax=Ceratopteris richardii TaxID=49495 RepID=A0A8T2SYQ2_CERRI|nr:hypothetical protein KP509_17G069200 [Ceratopteris richardii]